MFDPIEKKNTFSLFFNLNVIQKIDSNTNGFSLQFTNRNIYF